MKTRKYVFPFLAFCLLFLTGIFLMHYLQSALRGTTMTLGVDLYPRWIGSQEILHGESPYSLATRQKIWQAIYGSPEQPSGNPFGFYYPPAISTILAPFILLGLSVQTGSFLWCAFLWALWGTFTLSALETLKTSGKLTVPLLFASGLLFRPAFSNYLLGQYSLFCVLMVIAAWLSFRKDRGILAGILAALALIKPSLTLLPVALLFVFYWRDIKGIVSFILTSIVLYLPPTLLVGWWVPGFIHDISRYAVENRVSWSLADLGTVVGVLWLAASGFLVLWGVIRKDPELALASALALNALFLPHTADYDLVAWIWLIGWLGGRWFKLKRFNHLSRGLFFLVIWFPWLSLLFFVRSPVPGVEGWYRFIWLVYPLLISLFAAATLLLWHKMPTAWLERSSQEIPAAAGDVELHPRKRSEKLDG